MFYVWENAVWQDRKNRRARRAWTPPQGQTIRAIEQDEQAVMIFLENGDVFAMEPRSRYVRPFGRITRWIGPR
jgi:hypothetical protein